MNGKAQISPSVVNAKGSKWDRDSGHVQKLTCFGRVTPNGDAKWRHRIWSTWVHVIACYLTNVDYSSVRSYGIHLRAISQEMLKISSLDMCLKITILESQPHLSVATELKFDVLDLWLIRTDIYGPIMSNLGSQQICQEVCKYLLENFTKYRDLYRCVTMFCSLFSI